MSETIFIFIGILVFLLLCFKQYNFQKGLWMPFKESFTPLEVNQILQPPGSTPIGSVDSKWYNQTQMLSVSNGYTSKQMDNLELDNPNTLAKQVLDDSCGDFPNDESGNYILPTTQFQYPNDYKFTVKYPCRRTATGMFSDCGVWSANTAWTADPYKGLNCKYCEPENTRQPVSSVSNKREQHNPHNHERKAGISGTGNARLS
jgi:hypothetical protein